MTGALSETSALPDSAAGSGTLGSRIFRNTVAQGGGRIVISIARLAAVSAIVRLFGPAVFAEYSIVIVFLALGEWLVDFGTTETFVRDVSREPQRTTTLLRQLFALRLFQVPVAIALLMTLMFALGYSDSVLEAGAIGSLSLLFFGGALVFRVLFRSTLTMEREIVAELASVLVLIPLFIYVARSGGGLAWIFAAQVVSRAVFFLLSSMMGRRGFTLSLEGVSREHVRTAIAASATIGVSGLVVMVYDTVDVLLLARVGTLTDVAFYSGAQKFVFPLIASLSAVATTFYPVMASYWPHSRADFERAAQQSLDTAAVVTGLAVTPLLAAPVFLMQLLSPELSPGAPALQLLAVMLAAKITSMTVGPILYLVYAQRRLLHLVTAALVIKVALVYFAAKSFGFVGVAGTAVVLELAFLALAVRLVRRCSGFAPRWNLALRVVLIIAVCVGGATLLFPGGGFAAGVVAGVSYLLIAVATHAVPRGMIEAVRHKFSRKVS